MRRKCKQIKHEPQRRHIFHADITVNDYADSLPNSNSGARVKKGVVGKTIMRKHGLREMHFQDRVDHNIAREKANKSNKTVPSACEVGDVKEGDCGKEEVNIPKDINDVDWFDRDFDDLDSKLEHIQRPEDFTDEVETSVKPKKRQGRKRQRKVSDEGGEIVFPIDLWFQVSRFIHPESIATFALICKGTHRVVNTIQFWKGLFLRFYFNENTKEESLPDHLKLENIERVHGLRCRVIQMLYIVYPPLSDRSKTTVPFENEPHGLVGQRCVLMWHYKHKNVWKFCFKFHKGDQIESQLKSETCWESRDFVDLFHNPDNNCTIMEVTCSNFISIPSVMGLVLNQVYLSVSSGMRYHRVKLMLDTSYKSITTKTQTCMTEVVLDPALEMRVHPWWDPNYQRLLYSISDSFV